VGRDGRVACWIEVQRLGKGVVEIEMFGQGFGGGRGVISPEGYLSSSLLCYSACYLYGIKTFDCLSL
jgi:hypothetical protein